MLVPNLLSLGGRFSSKSNVPDDYPPEGSMHFIRYPKPEFSIPDGFVQYNFSSNWGEDDRNVMALGEEIIHRLGDERQVFILINGSEPITRKQKAEGPWVDAYTKIIDKCDPRASVFPISEYSIACLTSGISKELGQIYWRDEPAGGCEFEFYLFPPEIIVETAKQAICLIKDAAYQMRLLPENGPLALDIIVNEDRVDIATIENIIQAACLEKNILLQNPNL